MAPTAAVDALWSTPTLSQSSTDLSTKSHSSVTTQHIEKDDSSLQTVDELLRSRATAYPHMPIVSYPTTQVEYVDYTFQQLDVFAYRAAKHLESNIPTRTSSEVKRTVIALIGPSNLEYLVTMMALIKAGHTVLFLSTRIPAVAIESLVKTTNATYLIADAKYLAAAATVKEKQPALQILDMPGRSIFEFPIEVYVDTQLDAALDVEIEKNEIVYIIHSSGSTGLPKPIYQKQIAALSNYNVNMDMKAFITLPLYHNHGICNLYRAMWSRKSIHLYNADLPLTSNFLIKIMRVHKFEIFYGVPYALKLLAETDEGLELLASLKTVMYGGSACPDDLGDLLVKKGVNLISHYGATEVGQLMTSFRPAADNAWNYVRENERLSPFLYWLPQGPNLFECCVRQGWPAKTATNMDDGSYRTKDIFEPHPSIPGAWKYIARLDDTIVLVNGEKFNPVVTEGRIRSSRLVTEAVVFGVQQPYLGVLVVPSAATAGKAPAEVLETIWPVVDAAQEGNDSFAKISRDMVVILPHDSGYPCTDKGSVIRQACYKAFAKEIEIAYEISSTSSADARDMSESELKKHLRDAIMKSLPQAEFDDETDFFALGLDSLQAIQIRAGIMKSVRVQNKLTQNVVFDHPSITRLSAYLLGTAGSQDTAGIDTESDMKALVEKYSDFSPPARLAGTSVVVTGATGSLGAHIVAKLVKDPSIERVYCFVRARDTDSAIKRTVESLALRKVYHNLSLTERRKVVAIPADLSQKDLGLDATTYREVSSNLHAVIHSAWSVNFNLNLSSFEKDNIAGLKNLLTLCQNGSAAFNFCSSVSAVARHPDTDGPVPEAVPKFEWAQGMGYAQSKSVAETICARAAEQAGIPVRVLRIGQIVADTVHGVWNATEGVPMVIQSAITTGTLPRLQEDPSWLPVDVVAQGVVEISLSDTSSSFTNIANHKSFSWTRDLLPALRDAGLQFEEVEPKEWVRRLRESNPDPVTNPPIKLVDFFASKYDRDDFGPSKQYATTTARSLSPTLDNGWTFETQFVKRFIAQFLSAAWKVSKASPSENVVEAPLKNVIIVTGPCGSGKSSLASALAKHLGAPFVEGDSLHSRAAVESMRAGLALVDGDRQPWLARINKRVEEELYDLGHPTTVVSCSSLKQNYRDALRQIGQTQPEKIRVSFLDLQCTPGTLLSRLQQRSDHYMQSSMVQSQVEDQEKIADSEADVYPLDGDKSIEEVFMEASAISEQLRV